MSEDAGPMGGGAGFPVRVAAIDAGSNAIRFLAAEFDAPLDYRVLAELRAPVRLGSEVFRTGRLDREVIAAAAAAIASFRERLDALQVAA
jgi:exopolyphosphatase / guanosine-5'-triphosphate,3'-diphosphate pyrophosphatase